MIDKGSFSSLRKLSDCTQRTNNFLSLSMTLSLFFYLYGCSNEVYFTFFHSSSFQNTLASQTLIIKSKVSVEFRVYGHTTEKAPVLVRSPKLTSVGPA